MGAPSSSRTLQVADRLWAAIELMSSEMQIPPEALVNQALFSWAKMNGYLEASPVEDVTPMEPAMSELPRRPQREVVLVHKGKEIAVKVERFLIGRDRSCDLAIDSALLSRSHAAIHVGAHRVEVEDLGSSNGTWFDSERITRREVRSGDVFVFGDVSIRIELRPS
jgi:hypothetical protein